MQCTHAIYDPLRQVLPDVLTVYRLVGDVYERQDMARFPGLQLGPTLWQGTFEGKHDTWLRWTDEHGAMIPTGRERAEQAEQLLRQERQRAEHLAALPRRAGIDPEQAG